MSQTSDEMRQRQQVWLNSNAIKAEHGRHYYLEAVVFFAAWTLLVFLGTWALCLKGWL